ncbi:MAG: hypothetical protein IH587_10350, partial [Anaerolineae bacterium]|nr:hypothetical protein [Anaerolineae bacterium]
MGIQLNWDNEAQTVLHCQFESNWTWDDLFEIADRVKAITDNTPHTVAAIINLTDGMTIPGGNFFSPTAFANARQLLTLGEGGTGPVVIVGATTLIKMVYESFKGLDSRAAKTDITFTDTL